MTDRGMTTTAADLVSRPTAFDVVDFVGGPLDLRVTFLFMGIGLMALGAYVITVSLARVWRDFRGGRKGGPEKGSPAATESTDDSGVGTNR